MRVVILAAGKGSRLGNIEKATLKIGDQYLIEYSFKNALKIDHRPIIVISRSSSIPSVLKKYNLHGISQEYVIQEKPLGTMNAIEEVVNQIGLRSIFLMLADEILFKAKVRGMYNYYLEHFLLDGVLGFVRVKDSKEVKKTYEVRSFNSIVKELIEKPLNPSFNLKGTGYCIIGKKLLGKMIESKEKNFVEAIDWSIKKGCLVSSYEICKDYVNVNTPKDLEEAFVKLKKYRKREGLK